jgi:anti-sigma factor RsiW
MEKVSRLTQAQRENLVAYLDGELEDAESQEIDRILARSDVARHEVEALSRAWDMLDLLPNSTASADFTNRTMATLKLEESPYSVTDKPWFIMARRGAVAAVWLAAMAVCGGVGYLATSVWYPNPHREMLEELPLIRQLDVYGEVESIEFLEQLNREGVFEGGGDNAAPTP